MAFRNPHGALFRSIIECEDAAASSSRNMPSSRGSSMLDTSHSYQDAGTADSPAPFKREDHHSALRTDFRSSGSGLIHHPSRSGIDHHRPPARSPNSTVDLSALIPMYGETDLATMASRSQLIDLAYTADDWQPSSVSYRHTFIPPQQWGSSLSGAIPQPLGRPEYPPYSPPSSSTSPASHSLADSCTPSLTDALIPLPTSTDEHATKKSCFHCHVTSTPLWRREPSTRRTLCNACGLYLLHRHQMRPQALIDADLDDGLAEIPDEEYTGLKCSHCLARQTSVWRRSKTGALVCNACGVYFRLHGEERPLSLRRNKIKPRSRRHLP